MNAKSFVPGTTNGAACAEANVPGHELRRNALAQIALRRLLATHDRVDRTS
jgi:hypothetical protein